MQPPSSAHSPTLPLLPTSAACGDPSHGSLEANGRAPASPSRGTARGSSAVSSLAILQLPLPYAYLASRVSSGYLSFLSTLAPLTPSLEHTLVRSHLPQLCHWRLCLLYSLCRLGIFCSRRPRCTRSSLRTSIKTT